MKWLSVNDCLPSVHNDLYRLFSNDVLVTDGKQCFIAQLFVPASPDGFEDDVVPVFVRPGVNLNNISHWMSLPDLPIGNL